MTDLKILKEVSWSSWKFGSASFLENLSKILFWLAKFSFTKTFTFSSLFKIYWIRMNKNNNTETFVKRGVLQKINRLMVGLKMLANMVTQIMMTKTMVIFTWNIPDICWAPDSWTWQCRVKRFFFRAVHFIACHTVNNSILVYLSPVQQRTCSRARPGTILYTVPVVGPGQVLYCTLYL